jgi:hypothetical protein
MNELGQLTVLPFVMVCYFISHAHALVVCRALESSGRLRGRATVMFWIGLLVLASLSLGMIVPFELGLVDMDWWSAREGLVVGLFLPPAALLFGILAVHFVRALPSRRRVGPPIGLNTRLSRVLRLLARTPVVVALGILSWAWATGLRNHPPSGLEMALVVMLVPVTMFIFVGLARRSGHWLNEYADRFGSSAAATPSITEPRTLYLRPFDEEHRLFAETQTFEEFLAAEVDGRIGRLIALGNPSDWLAPGPVQRLYQRDEDWQQVLEAVASSAACVLGVTSASANTSWELRRIRELNLHDRLFLFAPPSPISEGAPERTQRSRLVRALTACVRLVSAYIEEDTTRLTRML